MKKSALPLEFIIQARVGDAVLNHIVSKHVDGLTKMGVNPAQSHALKSLMVSNSFISNFRTPRFKVKGVDNTKTIKGDKVESYIAFLYHNLGYDKVKAYILKEIQYVITYE